MGVTLTAKNPIHTFNMGYGGFLNLRTSIADLFDKEFGEHYRTLQRCYDQADWKKYCRIGDKILSHPRFKDEDYDILDFLHASSSEGKMGYKTCGKIYRLIKDADFEGKIFRYAAYSHNDYEELKEFLKDCYSHRKNAVWY